ncbi:MAG: hypothetical protein OJF59_003027 [Cytophagales bacterium]|jgi:hypothetical protein|nr:carboxypeptidase regulatory-like domain-containing protein [Bacteroidota bacterium]MBS1979530.1 carboxypeptidase regulatory-like domain-containing protein [Bacteroidota bacterium]WHZ09271.1 MAG: hypothetical protein OJF59_003027 [Cytophagales bacterium]
MKLLAVIFLLQFGLIYNPIQLFNTSLTVTVRDELGNTVEGVSVKIFEKQEDFTKEVNAVEEATTDKKGIAKFKKLKPESYFILCRKGDKDNVGGGEKVGQLKKGEFNKVTVVIQ